MKGEWQVIKPYWHLHPKLSSEPSALGSSGVTDENCPHWNYNPGWRYCAEETHARKMNCFWHYSAWTSVGSQAPKLMQRTRKWVWHLVVRIWVWKPELLSWSSGSPTFPELCPEPEPGQVVPELPSAAPPPLGSRPWHLAVTQQRMHSITGSAVQTM